MDQVIIDACVGAKWFLEEEFKEKADALLERALQREIKLIVPEFFYSELGSILWKGVRKKLVAVRRAQEILNRTMELPLQTYSDRELSDVAMDNAMIFGISVYDALYLSLAEVYVAPLITADKALFKACHKRFDFIEYLGDLKEK